METLRYHDARLKKNRRYEIRKVFISLRQLIRVVTNRYSVFPQIDTFSSERFMNERESREDRKKFQFVGKRGSK